MDEKQIAEKEKLAPEGYSYCGECDIYFPDPDNNLNKWRERKSELEAKEAAKEQISKKEIDEYHSISLALMLICPLCNAKMTVRHQKSSAVLIAEHPHMQ